MTGIPLDPDAFPHEALVYPATYARGAGSAPSRGDSGAVSVPCNGQLAGNDRLEAVPRRDGEAIGSRVTYDLSLPGAGRATAPQLAAVLAIEGGDRVDLVVAGVTTPLRASAPAAPVFGGEWYRVRATAEA